MDPNEKFPGDEEQPIAHEGEIFQAFEENKTIGNEELPISEYRKEIVESIKGNDRSIVIGETGSGKTTQIPLMLLDEFPEARIAVTQPRQIAARAISSYVAEKRGGEVGGEVGYQVRFEDQTSDQTRLNFMTDGILLKKFQNDPMMLEYGVVMVDEAHERSLNIDFTLGLLKRAQKLREENGQPELKVIVTSATIEKDKFTGYFGDAPAVEVPGRLFPVDIHYEPTEVENPIEAAAKKVAEIDALGKEGDILIFMPGEAEIKDTLAEIEKACPGSFEILPLFGSMSPDDQKKIFQKYDKRKVIVATNIAETSLTIDGIRHVIDSGLIRQKEFNPSTGIEALVTEEHAQSGCNQRAGRAGRTQPGECYRLYTEGEYNQRQPFQTPEIARSNLDHVVLQMKRIGIENIQEFEFIDQPSHEAIAQAITTLKRLGALDDAENLTEIGIRMSELPLKPESARMVIEAEKFGCTESIAAIAAMAGEDKSTSYFFKPKSPEEQIDADDAQRKFKTSGSDFRTALEVWEQWEQSGFSKRFAKENYLNLKHLREAGEIRAQLLYELQRSGIRTGDNFRDPEAIDKSVASGLIQGAMRRYGRFSYQQIFSNSFGKKEVFIPRASAAYNYWGDFLIGKEIVTIKNPIKQTEKTYSRKNMPLKLEWLPEIAPQLLDLESKNPPEYDPLTDAVYEISEYKIKDQPYMPKFEHRARVWEAEKMKEAFINAVLENKVEAPFVFHNNQVMEKLKDLERRSGGVIRVPDLEEGYRSMLANVSSRAQAERMDKDLRININDLYPAELITEIEKNYPRSITIKDTQIDVDYEYTPESYRAILNIPHSLVESFTEEDIPSIGAANHPTIAFSSSYVDGSVYNTIEELKAAIKEENEYQSERMTRRMQYETPFEEMESEENISPELIEAQNEMKEAGSTITELLDKPEKYGMSPEEQQRFRNEYNYIRSFSLGDLRYDRYFSQRLIEKVRALVETATRNKVERERRIQLLPDMKDRVAELAKTLGPITLETCTEWGLSIKKFNSISSRWQRVNKLLETENSNGETMPDPEKAANIIDQLGTELVGLEKKSKEEQEADPRIMTEKVREAYTEELEHLRIILNIVRGLSVVGKGKEMNAKMEKTRNRADEVRKDLIAFRRELETTENAERAQSLMVDLRKRTEKVANEMAYQADMTSGWSLRFKLLVKRIQQIAKEQDVPLDDATRDKIHQKIFEFASKNEEIGDQDELLESILIDSL